MHGIAELGSRQRLACRHQPLEAVIFRHLPDQRIGPGIEPGERLARFGRKAGPDHEARRIGIARGDAQREGEARHPERHLGLGPERRSGRKPDPLKQVTPSEPNRHLEPPHSLHRLAPFQ
jgi:hypothetical protein